MMDQKIGIFPKYVKHYIGCTDISKQLEFLQIFLFAAHDVLSKEHNPAGYLLLRCLRSYLNIRMWADLDLHTEGSICAGRWELEKFANLMQV